MYSLSNPLEKYFSREAENIETVEDSCLEKEKSPLVALTDQESLFHVQSSISSTKESFESKSQQVAEVSVKRDIQIFRSNYIARSEDKNITEELKYEYSEEVFESSASETIQHEEVSLISIICDFICIHFKTQRKREIKHFFKYLSTQITFCTNDILIYFDKI